MADRLFSKQIIFNKQHFGHYYMCVNDHHQKIMSYNVIKKMTLCVITLDLNALWSGFFHSMGRSFIFWHNNWFGDWMNHVRTTFFIALCKKKKYFNPSLSNCTKIINTNTLCTHTFARHIFNKSSQHLWIK